MSNFSYRHQKPINEKVNSNDQHAMKQWFLPIRHYILSMECYGESIHKEQESPRCSIWKGECLWLTSSFQTWTGEQAQVVAIHQQPNALNNLAAGNHGNHTTPWDVEKIL